MYFKIPRWENAYFTSDYLETPTGIHVLKVFMMVKGGQNMTSPPRKCTLLNEHRRLSERVNSRGGKGISSPGTYYGIE